MLKYYKEVKSKIHADVTTVPAILEEAYFQSIDGLRGMAILMVTLAHIGINHFFRPFHFYIESRLGVNLFFVISGFLITALLIKEKIKTGKISLRHFYIRRTLRIIPLAYLFLVIVIILNLYYRLKIPLSDFMASFLFFKNLPLKNVPLTAHFWTLAVEEQFYITFPFLLAANINKYLLTALSIIIIIPLVSVLGSYQIQAAHLNPGVHFFFKIMMYAFWKGPIMILIGSVFAILSFKGIIKPLWISRNYFSGIILFVFAIVIQSRNFIAYRPYFSECLSSIILAYTIVCSIKSNDLLSVILKNKILVRTGIISYSIYIWQELFIGSHVWQPWLSSLNQLPLYLLMIIKLIIIFVVAFISYYFFESRFLRYKERFK